MPGGRSWKAERPGTGGPSTRGKRPGRLRRYWTESPAGRLWQQARELELLHRSMGFAAFGLVTLMPVLILVAAADPLRHRGFGEWVVDAMGLSGRSAHAVRFLFSTPSRVLSTTSAYSVVALALFGLSFSANMQTGYERIWDLTATPLGRVWRQAVWLVGLTAYLFLVAQGELVPTRGWAERSIRVLLILLTGVLLFWWGQRLLLGRVLPWPALLPGAVATMLGLVGLWGFSALVFAPLIVDNAVSYGAVGTLLIVESWLIGAGYVVFGGALLGRHFHEWRTGRPVATGDHGPG